jgi:uroporphyrin-3 C-methyltransferase
MALVIAVTVLGYLGWFALKQELARLDQQLSDTRERQEGLGEALQQANLAVERQRRLLAEHQASLEAGLTQYEAAMRTQIDEFASRQRRLDEEADGMQRREAELREALADVNQRMGRSSTEWMVAEAEYLIRLAIYRLELARDAATARTALELADQRLRDTLDPALAPVREELARDIAALRSLPQPDIPTLTTELSTLAQQVPTLRLAGTYADPPAAAEVAARQTSAAAEPRSWRTLLPDFWTGLRGAVRIRRTDDPLQTLLAPQHQRLVLENVELQLQAASLAAVRGEQQMYRHSLGLVQHWLDEFFDRNDDPTQALQRAVDRLAAVDVAPELPDVARALRLLQERQAPRPQGEALGRNQVRGPELLR